LDRGAAPLATHVEDTPYSPRLSGRIAVKQVALFERVKDGITRAGPFKLFLLGLAIGVGIGILGGRIAERFRLLDYVAIEEIILERERPPVSRLNALPETLFPRAPSRM
jgi:hypothetical protein